MVETMMRLKPVAERTSVTVHFLEADQFLVAVSEGLEGATFGGNVLWVLGVEGFVKRY